MVAVTDGVIHYRWAVLCAGTAAQITAGAFIQGLPAIGPVLRTELGLSLAAVGVVLACPMLGVVSALLLWGRICDRWGEHNTMGVGLALAGLLMATAASVTPSAVAVAVLLAVAGAATASVCVASGSAVMAWFPKERRGLAMGVRACGLPAGAALAAATLPIVAHHATLSAAFGVLSAACLVAGIVVVTVVREPDGGVPLPVRGGGKSTVGDPRLLRLSLASGLLVLPQVGITALLALFLVEHRGADVATASAMVTMAQLSGVASRIGAGVWSDAIGSRLRPVQIVAVAAVPLALLTAMLVDAPSLPFVGTLLLLCATILCWNGLAFSAAGELAAPGYAATALAVQNTAIFGGSMLAAPLGAALAQYTSWQVAFAALALPAAAAALVLNPMARTAVVSVRAAA
ncbi:MFS transporter [Phytohabitans flavus]|uniref:MFS transporter n=1 Tax=Phytohabitans flavus TaxID=1076124 RepID=A0A6F8XR35_9ACTN|nr:MFS transporter [Phytohabitans flavus]BCB76249.1 MFS transporter [Phytohabitans flavus]